MWDELIRDVWRRYAGYPIYRLGCPSDVRIVPRRVAQKPSRPALICSLQFAQFAKWQFALRHHRSREGLSQSSAVRTILCSALVTFLCSYYLYSFRILLKWLVPTFSRNIGVLLAVYFTESSSQGDRHLT